MIRSGSSSIQLVSVLFPSLIDCLADSLPVLVDRQVLASVFFCHIHTKQSIWYSYTCLLLLFVLSQDKMTLNVSKQLKPNLKTVIRKDCDWQKLLYIGNSVLQHSAEIVSKMHQCHPPGQTGLWCQNVCKQVTAGMRQAMSSTWTHTEQVSSGIWAVTSTVSWKKQNTRHCQVQNAIGMCEAFAWKDIAFYSFSFWNTTRKLHGLMSPIHLKAICQMLDWLTHVWNLQVQICNQQAPLTVTIFCVVNTASIYWSDIHFGKNMLILR